MLVGFSETLHVHHRTPQYWLKFVCFWRDSPQWARASSFTMFLDHTQLYIPQSEDSSGRVISSSQRPLPDNTQHSQQTDIHAPGGIRNHSLSRREVADLRPRPRSHWDRRWLNWTPGNKNKVCMEAHVCLSRCGAFINKRIFRAVLLFVFRKQSNQCCDAFFKTIYTKPIKNV